MPRSPIPRIQQRAKEIVEELNADNLLMAEVLDALALPYWSNPNEH
jgi:hypothetical protein